MPIEFNDYRENYDSPKNKQIDHKFIPELEYNNLLDSKKKINDECKSDLCELKKIYEDYQNSLNSKDALEQNAYTKTLENNDNIETLQNSEIPINNEKKENL